MCLTDAPCDGKSDAEAAGRSGARRVRAVKAVKQPVHIARDGLAAFVCDGEPYPAPDLPNRAIRQPPREKPRVPLSIDAI